MDAQQPLAPSSGVPLATGHFTVERHLVILNREVRALARHFNVREEDVRPLTAAIYDCARRLREAGACGIAELGIGAGPSLQVTFRASGSHDVITSLPAVLAPLQGVLRDWTVAFAPDGATIHASVPIPADASPQLPPVPALLPNPAIGPTSTESLLEADSSAVSPFDESADAELASMLQAELDEVNQTLLTLLGELAEARERLDAALAQATTLQKRADGRAGDVAAANRAIEDFLSMLSHELRTPLNAILGWTRLLRMGYLDQAGSTRALDALERNAHVQAQLVGDILDASRIVTGQLQLEIRPVAIAAIIDAAIDFVKPYADAKRITIERAVIFQGQLSGDPDRLQQVVMNLLSNAIKFTPEGGHVRVSLVPASGEVTLTVSDTGEGIDQAFLPFVFERFRQADASVTRPHRGLGLGLSIARHIVELHGGCIDVASDGPGCGAAFSVHLPASSG